MELSERIRTLREDKGLSQKQLAKEVKLTQVTISRLEHGRIKELKSGALIRLAEALDVTIDGLLGIKKRHHQSAPPERKATRWARIYSELPPTKRKFIDTCFELISSSIAEKPSEEKSQDKPSDEAKNNAADATDGPVYRRNLYIASPKEVVWQAIVNPEFMSQFFICPVHSVELKIGGEIFFGSPKKRVIDAEIMELKLGNRLVHSFAFTTKPAGKSQRQSVSETTRVIYELHKTQGLTRLEFTHDGFTADDANYKKSCEGWDLILSGLKTFLETGKPLSK